jgi:hypothetical protein
MYCTRRKVSCRDGDVKVLKTYVQALFTLAVIFGLIWQVLEVGEGARANAFVFAIDAAVLSPVATR